LRQRRQTPDLIRAIPDLECGARPEAVGHVDLRVTARDYIGRCRGALPSGGGAVSRGRLGGGDDRTAEAAVTLIRDCVLPGRHGALRLVEADVHGAVGARRQQRRLLGLAVTYLDRAAERRAARRSQPVPAFGEEGAAGEPRVIVPLHDDQGVARGVLGSNVPRLLGMAGASADLQAAALAEGVEGQSLVGTEGLAVNGLDGARALGEEAGQELAEWALADEADAGAVGLVEHRQARPAGALAHARLVERAERHQRVRELRARYGVEEIALVLGGVRGLEQARSIGGGGEARVVSGREVGGAEPARPLECHAELDLAVAEHVGVRGASGAMFAQEMLEHPLPVFAGETGTVQRDGELSGHGARVLEVLGGGAVAVVVLVPVAEEQSLRVPARLAQQQRGDRGVDAAGEPDEHAGRGTGGSRDEGRHAGSLAQPAGAAGRAAHRVVTVTPGAQAALVRSRCATLARAACLPLR